MTIKAPPVLATARASLGSRAASSCDSGSTAIPRRLVLAELVSVALVSSWSRPDLSSAVGWAARRTVNVFRTPPLRSTVTSTVSPGFLKPDALLQLRHVVHRLAVERDDHVARLDARALGRRGVAGEAVDHHAANVLETDGFGVFRLTRR